jgi:hypothetical protein
LLQLSAEQQVAAFKSRRHSPVLVLSRPEPPHVDFDLAFYELG